jgi:hypothetical protein
VADGSLRMRLRQLPSPAWNRDDGLQDMLVRTMFRRAMTRPIRYLPTAEGFGAAVRAGLGSAQRHGFARLSVACGDDGERQPGQCGAR